MTKVNHIDAVFGGEPVRFTLSRDAMDTQLREASAGHGSFDSLRRFLGGYWTGEELLAVLSHAHPVGRGTFGLKARTDVEDILRENGTGIYAVLAAKIVEAYLYGVSADQATFNEAASQTADEI